MNRLKTIFICIIIELILIFCVGCANLYPNPIQYFFFYNVLYGMVFSFLIPHSYYKVVVFIDPLQGLNTISITATLYLFYRYGYDI